MTTYKDIRGTHIVTVTSDPPAPVNGQVWYNSTDQAMKGFTDNPAGSWATSNNMNTARDFSGSAGIQTSSLVFGGQPIPSMTASESYNGTSWTNTPSMGTGRRDTTGAGASNTAAIAIGGQDPGDAAEANVELYNGSSWTEVGDLNTSRRGAGGSGTSTSALASGGSQEGGAGTVANTESWNGSSWTETTDLNTARSPVFCGAAGASNTSQINVKGSNTEQYNGSSWTEVADLNTSRLGAAAGTSTATLVTGGSPQRAVTETWNGSAWTEVGDLNTGRSNMAGAGTTTAGLGMGGETSTVSNATEEFTSPASNTVTFTAS